MGTYPGRGQKNDGNLESLAMYRTTLTALAALAIPFAAHAADAPRPYEAAPAPAPVYEPAPIAYWTGPYVGVTAGWGWLSDVDSSSGVLLGGTLGWNFQADNFVFGLEGDISWSRVGGSETAFFPTIPAAVSASQSLDWLGTVRARAGALVSPNVLLYATGGLAFGGVENTSTVWTPAGFGLRGSSSDTEWGWTAGLGIEALAWESGSVKLEGLRYDLDTADGWLVRAGLNWHFN